MIALSLANEVSARDAEVIGPAETVDEALEAIKNADLDGAILDINLRGKAAFVLADALSDRHIPFVFATGYDCEIPARHAEARRFDKPIQSGVICDALEEAILASSEIVDSPLPVRSSPQAMSAQKIASPAAQGED